MTEPDPQPSPQHRPFAPWRTKWRWVTVYWIIQAIVLHAVWAALFWEKRLPQSDLDVWERITNPGLLGVTGSVIAVITCLQAVMLLPIRRPGLKRGSPGVRFLHCAVSGLAIAGVVWLALWPLYELLDQLNIPWANALSMNGWLSLLTAAIVWITAAAFLCSRENQGAPLILSVWISALAAALLLVGFLCGIWAGVRLITDEDYKFIFPFMCASTALGWAVATPLLLSFCRKKPPETALARISARLFLGTTIEAAAAIPLDVMIRRKSDCYCGEGTFWTLTLCWAVGGLCLGPVIFFAPFSRARKRWYAGHCEACGYDMSGCPAADRCPECGSGWKPAAPVQP